MNSEERRIRIKKQLIESSQPLTGTELAAVHNVSRQVVVQDMAVLRASGIDVQAGP
ncbi:MAG TPA: transcription repressor NadR, partial [Spirochaeta sp.]|nr:transcription repressor NadR [Spirochaeta sp.]